MQATSLIAPQHNALQDQVDALVTRFRSISKDSVTKILEQAKTVFEVEEDLGAKHKALFYVAVGLDPNGSTVRKLRLIGEQSPRFEPFLDKIPNTWTTLYELARLTPDDFRKVADSGRLTPFIAAKDIQEVVRGKKQVRKVTATFDIAAAKKPHELYERLQNVAKEFDVELGGISALRKYFEQGEHADQKESP